MCAVKTNSTIDCLPSLFFCWMITLKTPKALHAFAFDFFFRMGQSFERHGYSECGDNDEKMNCLGGS